MKPKPKPTRTTSDALLAREVAFVAAYCEHLNASRAARETGYCQGSAAVLMKRQRVKDAIQKRLAEAGDQNPQWKAAVMEFGLLALKATPFDFLDQNGDPKPMDDIEPESKACLQSWTAKSWGRDGVGKSVTIRLHNKVTVAALMAKILGMGEAVDKVAEQNEAIKHAGAGLASKLASLAEHRRKRSLAELPESRGASGP